MKVVARARAFLERRLQRLRGGGSAIADRGGIAVIAAGPGRGLRFDPGASNPEYGAGENELPVQATLERHLAAGDVFYDVGANVGFFTVIGARLVGPGGAVIAFEPVPENAARVRENARLNGFSHVDVLEEAVFRESGRSTLVLAEYSGGSMLESVGQPPDASGERIEVPMTTVDEVVYERARPAPHFVKIDVEGAELDVLVGMERTLAEQRPKVLLEVDDAARAGLEQKLSACRAHLEKRGYIVSRLDESYPVGGGSGWHVAHLFGKAG